jgi:LysR family glycine cleavage system transcriptional activator
MSTNNQKTSLRGLRTFCVAAEHASFRDAAERLFITASAVSHQIRNLEEELGLKLFERLNRATRLTEAGASLYEDVSPLIANLDTATSRHKKTESRSTLRISVQPFFASEIFVPSLNEFRQRHPEIDIKVDTSDESAEKHPSNTDVSIRVFKSPPKSLCSDRLFPLRLVPAASARFRDQLTLKGKTIVSAFPLIVHDSRPTAWKNWERDSGIVLPEEQATIRLDSMIAVARAAERGLGAALVPVQLSDPWFASGTLVRLFEHELETNEAYYLVCRNEDKKIEPVRLLRKWALQKFDQG